jgi:hypothetical protein
MKGIWREELRTFFRESRHKSIDKAVFPSLLAHMWDKLQGKNLNAGFHAAGLYPLDPIKEAKKIVTPFTDKETYKTIVNIPKDGNCIFSCFCEALHGHHQDKAVQQLREQAVDHVLKNFERYAHAVSAAHKTMSAVAYAKTMRAPGVYVDDPEISSLSEICKARTVIYNGPPSSAFWNTSINEKCNEKIVRLHLYQLHYSLIKDNYHRSDWVLVVYEGSQYPGLITDSTAADYEVDVMKRFGKNWVWPSPRDRIFYTEKDVIRKISAPVVCGSRGQFTFPDI